jgi:hypothetical protein
MSDKAAERFMFSALSYQENTVLPEFKEHINKNWIPYGDNNLFPDELVNLFNKSGIHNAIIESKTRMMVGDGIIQSTETEEEFSEATDDFIKHCNPYEDMTEVYKKCAMDYELYGLSYIEILWSKGRKKIAEINHLDATKIRWGKMENNRVKNYFYSQDWSNYRKEAYKPIEIPLFDNKASSARQILPIVRYTPALDYYAFPDYIAGVKWIQTDTEIANFHFNNLKNGMSPSVFFGFPVGETTNEERKSIVDSLNEKYTGTNNASKAVVSFYDAEGDKKPEVKILEQSNADKQYDLLNKTTLQQILVAHKVTNENLVGIATPGQLGSGSELLSSYEIYYNTVVKPDQQYVLVSFKKIMLVNGLNDIEILENQPLEVNFTESILEKILTQDEMREMIGYEPLLEEEIVSEEEIIEDESGVTIENKRWDYDFAGVRTIDRNSTNQLSKAKPTDLYVWRISNDKNQCPTCLKFNGKVKTLKSWLKLAIPGQMDGKQFSDTMKFSSPYGAGKYGTYCEDKCNCILRKVGK